MSEDVQTRPELIKLGPETRQRIRRLAARQNLCDSCGGADFEVGDALYLGFLFLDEDADAYLIALTCRSAGCIRPHQAITIHDSEAHYPEFTDREEKK